MTFALGLIKPVSRQKKLLTRNLQDPTWTTAEHHTSQDSREKGMTGSIQYSRGSVSKRKLDEAISSLDEAFKSPSQPHSIHLSQFNSSHQHQQQQQSSNLLQQQQSSIKKRKSQFPSTNSTPALESLLLHPPPSPNSSLPSAPPSYNPLSLSALLSRISSYRLSTYSPKPSSLSPLAASLPGWSNSGPPRERLSCHSCGAAFLVLPPSSESGGWDGSVGRRTEETYVAALKDKHESNCPWRMRGCSRSLYVVGKGETRSQVMTELREKAVRLAGLEGKMQLKYPTTELGEEEVEKLVKLVGGGSVSTVLALFGWDLASSSTSIGADAILHCDFCSRDVWLASYLTSTTVVADTTNIQPKPFDVVHQHAPFCAFISPPSPSALTGWESRSETLLQSRGRKRRESFEKDGKILVRFHVPGLSLPSRLT